MKVSQNCDVIKEGPPSYNIFSTCIKYLSQTSEHEDISLFWTLRMISWIDKTFR